jgi:hypothetical protein
MDKFRALKGFMAQSRVGGKGTLEIENREGKQKYNLTSLVILRYLYD